MKTTSVKKLERPSPTLTYEAYEQDSDTRLRELILYVAEKCASDPSFGAIKLNKILFYADFYAYAMTGRPLTGAKYMRLQHGPVPCRLVQVRQELQERGDIQLLHQQHFGFRQTKVVPLRKPKLDFFQATEINYVNEVIDHLWNQSATKVAAESHLKPWQIAGHRGAIPYEAVFLSDEEPTEYDVVRAQELITKHKWKNV